MLSRSELKSFQAHRDYPSVSILAPTHRTAPLNKQDPIKVKNLLRKALDRLRSEFNTREVAGVVKNLKELVRKVDWEHTLDGLALFASKERSAAVSLPFRVKPRAVVDEAFATRDLVYAFNRAPPYRVLVLSHQTRLYEAWTTVLDEHRARPFPMVHRGPGGASKLPGGQGVNRSAIRDEAHRQFFRLVDDAVGALQKANPLPLVVVGVERNLAFYREVARQPSAVVGMLAGNHDQTSPSALGKLVWPVFESGATLRRTEALVQLDDAVGAQRHASGIDQVWGAAVGAKCRTLLVEKEFRYPADLSPEGDRLLPYTGRGAAALDDAVNEVIERVMDAGGEVFFYPSGDLNVHQRIAAILRR
jgi:Bacterial archaeo-eukaryotic release factor family 3